MTDPPVESLALSGDWADDSQDTRSATEADDDASKLLLNAKKSKSGCSLRKEYAGYTVAVLTAAAWAIGTCSAQALGGYVPNFELNLFRHGVQFLCNVPMAVFHRHTLLNIRKSEVGWICVNCIAMYVCNSTVYEASIYLPVSTLGGMELTLSILFLALLSFLVSKEWKKVTTVSAAVCLVGTLLLLQPNFIFRDALHSKAAGTRPVCARDDGGNSSMPSLQAAVLTNDRYNTTLNDTLHSTPLIVDQIKGYTLIIITSASYALFITIARHRLQDVNAFILNIWMSITGMVFSAVLMFAVETPTFPVGATCVSLLLLNSFFGGMASIAACLALTLISGPIYLMLVNLQVVFYLVAQYTVLRRINPGHGNAVEIIGAVLVFIGSILEPIYSMRHEPNNGEPKDKQDKT